MVTTTHDEGTSLGDIIESMAREYGIARDDHRVFGDFGRDHLGYRQLPNGKYVLLALTISGNLRINLCDLGGIENGWCYDLRRHALEAILSLATWTGDGDPIDGWHRNPYDGRRRPDGDPSREIVRR